MIGDVSSLVVSFGMEDIVLSSQYFRLGSCIEYDGFVEKR
jgi:hypothetical protein